MADDKKTTELTENTSPIGTDIVEMVDDPGGSPLSQKITFTNFFETTLVTAAVGSMSTTAAGKAEAATAAETTTGGDATRAVTPDSLRGSEYGIRLLTVLVNDSTELAAGDGKAYFSRIPSYFNGWNVIGAFANIVAGTALVTIQIHNLTQGADLFTTLLTIDANEKDSKDALNPVVIDPNEDDLQTGDRFRVDIDGAGTGTTWLDIQLAVQKP